MAEKTGIAWTRSTFNPWIGCTKVSPGCDSCYAEALDKRHRWGGAEHWGAGVPRHLTSEALWSQPVRWNKDAAWERENGRLRNPTWHWERPGFWPVFCASLADVFDNEVPSEWRTALWELIRATPALTWLLLTKRIGNAAKMIALAQGTGVQSLPVALPNVWLGASVVNQEEADRDIRKLLATPAAKRFVSYEPALDQHIAALGRAPATVRATETDKAYAAGFFDGEGNISIAINERARGMRHAVYNMRVGASQCDATPLVWLRARWGGSIVKARRGPCDYHAWNCFARMASAFLSDVIPYLQVKRVRAELAIRFQASTFNPGRCSHSKDYRAQRASMKTEMNRLNAL